MPYSLPCNSLPLRYQALPGAENSLTKHQNKEKTGRGKSSSRVLQSSHFAWEKGRKINLPVPSWGKRTKCLKEKNESCRACDIIRLTGEELQLQCEKPVVVMTFGEQKWTLEEELHLYICILYDSPCHFSSSSSPRVVFISFLVSLQSNSFREQDPFTAREEWMGKNSSLFLSTDRLSYVLSQNFRRVYEKRDIRLKEWASDRWFDRDIRADIFFWSGQRQRCD